MKVSRRLMMVGLAALALMGSGLKGGRPASAGVFDSVISKLPTAVFQQVQPVLPDLSITTDATQSSCVGVKFTVTLRPGANPPSGNQIVKVRVIDTVFGAAQTVGEVLLYIPAKGGSATASLTFPTPADAAFQPDWSNLITVVVDPDNAIEESNKGNNIATVLGVCVG